MSLQEEKSNFYGFRDINAKQVDIMVFIDSFIRSEKTPVPQKRIVIEMERRGINGFTTLNALKSLVRKGYIRRSSLSMGNKGTNYIQLRSV